MKIKSKMEIFGEPRNVVEYGEWIFTSGQLKLFLLTNALKKAKGISWRVNDLWFYQFKKRNPKIVTRKPLERETERIEAANETNLLGFNKTLVELIEKYNFTYSEIHNVDESFIHLDIRGQNFSIKRNTILWRNQER